MVVVFKELLMTTRKIESVSKIGYNARAYAVRHGCGTVGEGYANNMKSLNYIYAVGADCVREAYKKFDGIYSIAFDIKKYRIYDDIITFYLAALLDKLDFAFPYEVIFRFEKANEKEEFQSKVPHICEIINKNNLKQVKCDVFTQEMCQMEILDLQKQSQSLSNFLSTAELTKNGLFF